MPHLFRECAASKAAGLMHLQEAPPFLIPQLETILGTRVEDLDWSDDAYPHAAAAGAPGAAERHRRLARERARSER